jgi:hypothetical protein
MARKPNLADLDVGQPSTSKVEANQKELASSVFEGIGKAPEPVDEVQQALLKSIEIEKAAKESMDFFAGLAMPLVFKYLFPKVFKAIWDWLILHAHKVRDFSQLAIGLPRGFGKTMVVKLFVLYCILFTKKKFILLIAGTQTKANNILLDICSSLSEKNIKTVFGDWKIAVDIDRQDMKLFSFRGRKIIIVAAGSQSDIRGITIENTRPDVIIFDDIQTREEANSEEVSDKLEQWMYGTAMKSKSPEGCLFIFIANMYPTKWSLLRRIKHNPNWSKVIAGGILADGTSLWEELQPIKQLLAEFRNDQSSGRPEVFYAEVLNDENASVNKSIDISRIPQNPYGSDELPQAQFIIIDPATDKPNADANSIGLFHLFDGKPVSKKILEGSFSPGKVVENSIRLCFESGCRLIFVESVAYQHTLCWIFNRELELAGISGIMVVPILPKGGSKNTRIMKMFPALLEGELLIGGDTWSQVISQITSFNPLKSNNTDGILDLLTYAQRIPLEFEEALANSQVYEMQEIAEAPPVSDSSVCLF